MYHYEGTKQNAYYKAYVAELRRIVPIYDELYDKRNSPNPWYTISMQFIKEVHSIDVVERQAKIDALRHSKEVIEQLTMGTIYLEFMDIESGEGSTWEVTKIDTTHIMVNNHACHIDEFKSRPYLHKALRDWVNGQRHIDDVIYEL